ncbi:MAG: YkgJ family cysteine cluster protein [Mangrovibacterium sp.]
MAPDSLTEHEKLFFEEGFRLGSLAAEQADDETSFLMRITDMYAAMDGLIDSILAMAVKQNVVVDCKKGCAFCCYQAVFANSYEMHFLSNYLKREFQPGQLKDVYEKAVVKNDLVSAMGEQTQLNYKSACPLLLDGACSAYEARPMACRIYLSMNVESCREFYTNPEAENKYPQLMEFPLMAGRMMNEGFAAALKRSDIRITEFRLEEGLATVLNNKA